MRIGTVPFDIFEEGELLHWALGPGEDWNTRHALKVGVQYGLHWALGPGEDWNCYALSHKYLKAPSRNVALGLRAW